MPFTDHRSGAMTPMNVFLGTQAESSLSRQFEVAHTIPSLQHQSKPSSSCLCNTRLTGQGSHGVGERSEGQEQGEHTRAHTHIHTHTHTSSSPGKARRKTSYRRDWDPKPARPRRERWAAASRGAAAAVAGAWRRCGPPPLLGAPFLARPRTGGLGLRLRCWWRHGE